MQLGMAYQQRRDLLEDIDDLACLCGAGCFFLLDFGVGGHVGRVC